MTAIETHPTARPGRHAESGAAHGAHQDHEPSLAHHWKTPAQQFGAAKLGMWLFVATEVLLFGGLFCLYATVRGNHPDVFEYGSQFLDTRWGAFNTAVLIISSMTMALAVTAAQRGEKRLMLVLLACTFMGGAIFMGVKYIEYSHKFHQNIYWGASFYDGPDWVTMPTEDDGKNEIAIDEGGDAALPAGDLAHGTSLWDSTCRSCHGAIGEGVTGKGKDLRTFAGAKSDGDLLEFIKTGRKKDAPDNTTGIEMAPKGGNPLLNDRDLLDVIAFIRTLDAGAAAPDESDAELFIPSASIPPAAIGPSGFLAEKLPDTQADDAPTDDEPAYPHHTVDPDRPVNAHTFFGIYFLMTGLHGIHVLIGMGVILWLFIRTSRNHFNRKYFTPVDIGGLYWHVVDLIWIFLFPLFYLI